MPREPLMSQPSIPPATTSAVTPVTQIEAIRARASSFKGGFRKQNNEMFNLPSAQQSQGVMLVLPEDIGLYADVISRWESITLNLVNEKAWNDNKSKVMYIENLLGEIEKKLFIQWRMTYPNDYGELEQIADDPQNVTSHIR